MRVVGLIAKVQGAALWVTVKVCPAMVTVPVRAVVAVFAATLMVTVPLPEPVAPAVTPIHEAALVAAQVQPAVVVTPTLVDSPARRRGAGRRVDSEGAGCRVLGDREGLPGDR